MNRNPIFVTTGRAAGHSYPAHELLESYAVTLYDLDVSRERQLRAATSSTEQANRARNAGRLQILEEKERDLREKAEALILKCQTPDEREMLRMRYLMLMDWATTPAYSMEMNRTSTTAKCTGSARSVCIKIPWSGLRRSCGYTEFCK